MSKTVVQMYFQMIKENKDGGWVNPKLEEINNPHFLKNFMIKLDDFKRIHESLDVKIYNISKSANNGYIIHCKEDFY